MKNRIQFVLVVAVLCAVSMLSGALIQEAWGVRKGTPVIGKAIVQKGVELIGTTRGFDFVFVAFKQQTVYVTEKVQPEAGIHDGGYVIMIDGFSHKCPSHGEEIIEGGHAGITMEQAESGDVEVILFEQGMPNAN